MENVKQNARLSLENAGYNPKKLALIHTGLATAAGVLISILSAVLDAGIAGTGGLSGMGLRAALSTAQSVLSMALTILLPFWELGFLFACVGYARQEQVAPDTLLGGFRRFRSALSLFLLETLLAVGIVMACSYACYTLFMFTPMFSGVADLLMPLLEDGGYTLDYAAVEALIPQLLPKLIPLYGIMAVAFLVVGVPFLYRFRLARYALCDGENRGILCLAKSKQLMRHKRLALFKLDLSFWWYYLLQIALTLVAYGDSLLALIGINLPVSSSVSYWLFYGLYAIGRLALAWCFAAYVQTSYAHFYHAAKTAQTP